MSIEFLLTTFIVVVSPATGLLYTLAADLSRGVRARVVAAPRHLTSPGIDPDAPQLC
jgi:hypothetical protein